MVIDDMIKKPGSWLSRGQETGVVVSSRLRLARNIRGARFPDRASEEESVRICERLREITPRLTTLAEPLFLEMGALGEVDKEVLMERHLISQELAEKGKGSAVIVAENERIAVMINEEDHLRLQAMSPGMNLPEVWEKVNAADSDLGRHLEYAFSPRWGYLTACPTNAGTGMRASVMMHLAGLSLMGEIDAVVKGLDKIGVMVRGLLGEGTEAYGNMFQVSNQSTLGERETAIMERLIRLAGEVARQEQNARARLLETKRSFVLDQIGRALGILQNARTLSSKEGIDMLSGLRLGVEFGTVRGLTVGRINEIMLLTQPGHLQRLAGRVLDAAERDETRARMVRESLMEVTIED